MGNKIIDIESIRFSNRGLYFVYQKDSMYIKKRKDLCSSINISSLDALKLHLQSDFNIFILSDDLRIDDESLNAIFNYGKTKNIDYLYLPIEISEYLNLDSTSQIEDLYDHEISVYYFKYNASISFANKYDSKIFYKKAASFETVSFCAPLGIRSIIKKDVSIKRSDVFNYKLSELIKKSSLSDPEVYKRSKLTKQLFSNIMTNDDMIPKKTTIFCLIIGLELNYEDANSLLESAGYALSDGILLDKVFKKILIDKIYDFDLIDKIFYENNLDLLGYKPR